MYDSVNAVKPMITFPGFADQPVISNVLIAEKVAKLLMKFTYQELEPILDEMLSEPSYSEMVARLQLIRDAQYKLGGNKKAVEVIEQMAEGKIVVNRTMASEDVHGVALYDVIAVCASIIVLIALMFIGLVFVCCRLCRKRPSQLAKVLKKKKSSKTD